MYRGHVFDMDTNVSSMHSGRKKNHFLIQLFTCFILILNIGYLNSFYGCLVYLNSLIHTLNNILLLKINFRYMPNISLLLHTF